jgi:hypothetical protein
MLRSPMDAKLVAAILLFTGTAWAQTVVDPAQLPAAVRNLDRNQAHPPLPCTVRQVAPSLNFDLRLQTGYVLQVPVGVYRGTAHHWYLVFRVTPEASTRQPVYFLDSVDIPPNSASDIVASVRGLFLVGEGRYDVNFSLLDDGGRVCRQSWTVDARLGKDEKATEAMLPPGTVADFSFSLPRGPVSGTHRRITVVMDILPAAPRFVRPGKPDGVEWLSSKWGNLVSMLAILMERNSAVSVRVVAISQTQQRETFLEDSFTLRDINRAVHFGDMLDQAPLNAPAAPNPPGLGSFFAGLVNREIHAEPRSSAVIFLGIPIGGKLPPGFRVPVTEGMPRFFYLQYQPNQPGVMEDMVLVPGSSGRPTFIEEPHFANSGAPLDCVEDCVRSLRGTTFTIYSAADFEKAIGRIEHTIQ